VPDRQEVLPPRGHAVELRDADGMLTKPFEALLDNLRLGYPVSIAIKRAGLTRSRTFELRATDDAFRAEWDSAYEEGTDAYVAEAARRAVQGIDKPVFYKGEMVRDKDTQQPIMLKEYSDRLLEFLLMARRPREFRQRYEITGANGEAIRIVLSAADQKLL
jgi:hypothetical protein